MQINKIVITGADDKINVEDLQKLQLKYPFVEWGILFSESREGKNRYPSMSWVARLEEKNLNLSAHLCGSIPKDIFDKDDFRLKLLQLIGFKRVQLNVNFKKTPFPINNLLSLPVLHPSINFILQANKSNGEVISNLENLSMEEINPFHFLYDSSGGRGKEIERIAPPFFYNYTGYSGGLNPNNVEKICERIKALPVYEPYDEKEGEILEDIKVFLDCETGVRDDEDNFDLKKVEDYLEKCSKFIS